MPLLLLLLGLSACRLDMHDQPKYEALEESPFFGNQRASQHAPEGTVARGQLFDDPHFYTGKVGGELVNALPEQLELSAELLARGQERYGIYCAPCHDRVGKGRGLVVQRGFKEPPSFHNARLLAVPLGHFFDVVTRGYGAMYSYEASVKPRDRWAIAAYIRALQLSQNARPDDVPEAQRGALDADVEGREGADEAQGGSP